MSERELFEQWATRAHGNNILADPDSVAMWSAWKAARSATTPPQESKSGVSVISALDVLADMGIENHECPTTPARFLRSMGKAGLLVIRSPLAAQSCPPVSAEAKTLRMLTQEEKWSAYKPGWGCDEVALQLKFCEVNGLTAPKEQPHA